MFHISAILLYALILCSSDTARSDSFPESYIQRQELEARNSLSVKLNVLAEGEYLTLEYVGRPIFIYKRSKSDIEYIQGKLANSVFTKSQFQDSIRRQYGSSSSSVWARLLIAAGSISTRLPSRSLDPRYLVIGGWSPSTGCLLSQAASGQSADPARIFRDPCSGAVFDASGQETRNGRLAQEFVAVPPHTIKMETVQFGLKQYEQLPALPFTRQELIGTGNPTQSLMAAAKYNDINAVRAALRDGAEVNYFKVGEGSPIDAAIIGSSFDVIELLLKSGAKPTPNSEIAASAVGRVKVISLLRTKK